MFKYAIATTGQKTTENSYPVVLATNSTIAPTAPTIASVTTYSTLGTATSGVIKGSAGLLFKIFGYNTTVTPLFFQMYDSATLPPDTTIPNISIGLSTLNNFDLDLTIYGQSFEAGISWALSTAQTTKVTTAAKITLNALYK